MEVLLHSKREAARLIGLSERTLHTLISTKQIRVRRVGKRVLVPPTSKLLKFAQRKNSIEKYLDATKKGLPEMAALGHEEKNLEQLVGRERARMGGA